MAGALALATLVMLAATLLSLLTGAERDGACGPDGIVAGPPGPAADAIPAGLLAPYRSAERRYGVPWNVLAAINKVETDFGRNVGVSRAGAVGWMQFLPSTWERYGVDGDDDGRKDPYDPADAIPAAARYLRASGAPGDLHAAILAYNHAEWYYRQVIAWARRFVDGTRPTRDATGDRTSSDQAVTEPTGSRPSPPVGGATGERTPCPTGADAIPGRVQIAPGANLPGRPLAAETLAFLGRVAVLSGRPLIVTTGTNHSRYTVDGTVSDHFDGHAADIGMAANGGGDDGPVGDAIAAACLTAAGDPPAEAAREARAGGLWTREHDGLRIQCIWKTDLGGNHHTHVHIGARPNAV